jgi:DTW domain-containing protein
MTRRDNAEHRCPSCRLHASLCLCALVPRLETRTRLVLFIHRIEDRKPTNTGRLATLCLPHSEVIVRGHSSSPTPPFRADPDTVALLLFPHEDAVPLAELSLPEHRRVTLVVPDGTWRQASKTRQRVSGLADMQCVSLPPGGVPSRYRLRAEAHDGGLATIEAIARAMGILEGEHVQRALERVFDTMVGRTLWARGCLDAAEVVGGIPEGAMRHDPRRPERPTSSRLP